MFDLKFIKHENKIKKINKQIYIKNDDDVHNPT